MTFPRDRQPERMDDPQLDPEEHRRALTGLARLNRMSGVATVMYRHLRRQALVHRDRPLSVLDVASGGGDVPIAWAVKSRREGLPFQLTLLDRSAVAVDEQQRRARARGVEVLSLQHDCLDSPLPSGFDIVTSSLFMHHLDDHQVFKLLQAMQASTEGPMLICDLDRSRFNLALVRFGARLLTRSPVVHHDASLSVRAAYTMDEFKQLAESALARPVRIQRSFPCRFLAVLDEVVIGEAVPAFA